MSKRWASDVIVDLLHAYDLPYAALNPGASYRGLHDSIVNYGANRPAMMLCQHEETAVQIAHGFARAYSVMMTEPRGPIYMCYDAWLQEQPLEHDVPLPPQNAQKVPSALAADPAALERAAAMLVAAEHPVILAEYVGRDAAGFHSLVELAETLGAPVYDVNSRLNFPGRHPLNVSMIKDVFRDADLVLCLDTRDWERATTELVSTTRETTSIVPATCKWVEIGFGDLEISSWAMDYQRLAYADLRVLADTTLAIPALTQLLKPRISSRARDLRSKQVAEISRTARAHWAKEAKEDWDASPITLPRLASEVWDAIKEEDWVLAAGTLEDWARKIWDFDEPYRHPGRSLGTATQIGISLGVALAHRDAGRLVVDLQPDGDLMFDAGALWVAAKHRIPLLVVMHNNRAYYNDWEHQIRMAKQRGTPLERAHIGMDLVDPAPDFAAMSKSMGWYAEGPIDQPVEIPAALKRAIKRVKAGQPALLDTITQKR